MRSRNEEEAATASEEVPEEPIMPEGLKTGAAAMMISRAANKSPMSDEGIEPDGERKRGSMSRCWSIDSAATSEEDFGQRRQKMCVSRCLSSDSAVLSDDEQNKCDGAESESGGEGRPRYWRTPSVVVSDYSDYSYFDERFERSDPELEKLGANSSASQSQTSSCSCLDCDELRDFRDLSPGLESHALQVCRHRRHSDSCCLCLGPTSLGIASRHINDGGNRRNSCLASSNPYYTKLTASVEESNTTAEEKEKTNSTPTTSIEFLDIPPPRKISDCSTISSISSDDFELTELQPVKRLQTSGWKKLRNIVHCTPFFQTNRRQRYPWVQLAGHQGNFKAGSAPGTILKKLCPQEETCFKLLMNDSLKPFVPEYKGSVRVIETEEGTRVLPIAEADNAVTPTAAINPATTGNDVAGDKYLQLEDLLGEFDQPCVMDCKVGVRTYLETELAKAKERPKLRKDMYEKMVQVDPEAPTPDERNHRAVTKPRYMVWRETISSTATLGFRVEGMKIASGNSTKDFKTTRTREQVKEVLQRFTQGYPHAVEKYVQRLQAIRCILCQSDFFASHEVVGSSLLFVHDSRNASIWLIDFAKTLPLPNDTRITHQDEWKVGNHEDGYLIGVNNLISILEEIRDSQKTET